jgi:hypothetical protein
MLGACRCVMAAEAGTARSRVGIPVVPHVGRVGGVDHRFQSSSLYWGRTASATECQSRTEIPALLWAGYRNRSSRNSGNSLTHSEARPHPGRILRGLNLLGDPFAGVSHSFNPETGEQWVNPAAFFCNCAPKCSTSLTESTSRPEAGPWDPAAL